MTSGYLTVSPTGDDFFGADDIFAEKTETLTDTQTQQIFLLNIFNNMWRLYIITPN